AHLLSLGVPAWQVLALTFTNKAAGEMRERVERLLADGDEAAPLPRGLTVTTFHALCARLLRRDAPPVGGEGGWGGRAGCTHRDDQQSLMKRVVAEMGLNSSNWPARSVLSAVSDAKNRLLDAAGFTKEAAVSGDFFARTVARIFEKYQQALRSANAVDFDDLL